MGETAPQLLPSRRLHTNEPDRGYTPVFARFFAFFLHLPPIYGVPLHFTPPPPHLYKTFFYENPKEKRIQEARSVIKF